MKKLLAIICLLLAFILIYFIQSNLFVNFTIAGIKPNLFIIFVLLIGLFAGGKIGMILGVCFGFILDLLLGRTIGISGIMLGIIGLIGDYLSKNFSKESRLTIMLMVMGATILYEVGNYIFNVVQSETYFFEVLSFTKILFIEVIYNAIIVIIVYPIVQRAGYALENTFKSKNILTRYF